MFERNKLAALIVYGLAATITFGHAFVSIDKAARERCIANSVKFCMTDDVATIGGVLAGAAWPLYWSVQIARAAKETK